MGHDRKSIVVLDNENASSKHLIESSIQMPTKRFSSLNQFLDNPIKDDVDAVYIDTDYITKDIFMDKLHIIKEHYHQAPLVAMTNQRNVEAIIELLNLGFDEFLLKPLNREDISVRIQVKKAQLGVEKERSITIGEIIVDASTRSIKNMANGRSKYLSPIEVNLLLILLASMGNAISREDVKRKCWGTANVTDNALNRKLFEVRRALTQIESNLTIKTLYGSGFAIQKKKGPEGIS
jgi:DNA-binding response OmpR family regulator